MDPPKEVTKKEKPVQPPWFKPEGTHVTGLKVNNSLCNKQHQEFVPAKGKLIRWYTCGPTVYDCSHLGHARNYLTFDILRRIMEDYFGYNVFYVMNITDIDDKIITKARENYFFKQYLESNPNLTQKVQTDLSEAWETHIAALTDKEAKTEASIKEGKGNPEEKAAALELIKENLVKAKAALKELKEATTDSPAASFIQAAQGPLSTALDKKLHASLDPELVKKIVQ